MGGGNVGDGVILDLDRAAAPPGDRTGPADRENERVRQTRGAQPSCRRGRISVFHPIRPAAAWATAGGAVSTNAAGARSVRYGSVRRWVEAVEFVTADGEATELRRGRRVGPGDRSLRGGGRARHPAASAEIAARFPHTRKNSSGYALDAYLASGDPLDLVIGAKARSAS